MPRKDRVRIAQDHRPLDAVLQLADVNRQAIAKLIAQLGPLPPILDLTIAEILEVVRRDKKVVNGKLHFVIPIQIGATVTIDDVTEDELTAVLRRMGLKQ